MRRTAEDRAAWTTYDDWYDGNWRPGAPRNPERALRLARRIAEDDFAEVVEPEEVENLAIEALTTCFADFDPGQGDQNVKVEDRFVRRFGHVFKRSLKDLKRDRASQERRKATMQYYHAKEDRTPKTAKQALLELRQEELQRQALRRLDRRAQEYVKYRFIERLTEEEAAARMGVTRGQLRAYGLDKLARTFRDAIATMVQTMSPGELDRRVYSYYVEDEFEEEEVAQLLFLTVEEVVRLVRRVTGRAVDGLLCEDGESGEAA